MTEDVSKNRSKKGCLTVFLIGCGTLLLVLIIVVVLVFANWETIKENEFVQSIIDLQGRFSEESSDLMTLRQSLIEKYPSDQLAVRIRENTSSNSDKTVIGLSIELINPEFIDNIATKELVEIAHEIALESVKQYPHINDYDLVIVKLTIQKSALITMTRSSSYSFPVSELLFELDN